MQVIDAIKQMLTTAHWTRNGVSAAMGRSRNFLQILIDRGTTPKTDTLARIANVMGYKLILEGHGEKIEIDPPPDK